VIVAGSITIRIAVTGRGSVWVERQVSLLDHHTAREILNVCCPTPGWSVEDADAQDVLAELLEGLR
jgi:hypothetical protein